MRRNVIIVRDFYDDPDEVRKIALTSDYKRDGNYHLDGYDKWLTSNNQHITDENVSKLKQIIKCDIDDVSWGKGWTGAFQVAYNINGELGYDYNSGCLHTHIQQPHGY